MTHHDNRLVLAKQNVMKERKSTLRMIYLLLSMVCLWLVLGIVFLEINALILAFLWAIPCFFEYRTLKKKDALLLQLSNLSTRRSYDVKISCAKIAMMNFTTRSKRPTSFGIKILDTKGKEYYYFFDGNLFYDLISIRKIREKISEEIILQCYENSVIVKSIENDPNYIYVKHGKLEG